MLRNIDSFYNRINKNNSDSHCKFKNFIHEKFLLQLNFLFLIYERKRGKDYMS